MKNKIMLSLSILLLSVNIYSQIAIQSFENSGDTWSPITYSTPPCTVGNDVWNAVSNLPGISPNDGSQFWGIRDLDGSCGGNGFETITLPNISVSSYSNVIFSFDFNAIGFDNNEDLKYELFFDNVSQGEVIVVNGVGGNSDNTNGWLTETVSIPSTVNNVSVILSAKCNSGGERAGFDNIRLAEAIANDNCIGAITLTVGSDITQNVVTGTNVGATTSGQLPNPSCADYQGGDIWYKTIVPASGIITIETLDAGSSIDTAIEVYTGSCNNLTQVTCHDDKNWPFDPYSKIELTGLANATIYIRVWAYSNTSSGDFDIVAYSPPECTATTRWNNSGWNNGAPNSFTSAIINANYDTTVNGSFESCDCQINNNSTVNIRANNYITVYNDLIVNGVLEVRDEGSLLMTDDNAQISVNGTFRAYKTSSLLNAYNDYTYWSSPVENQNISSVFAAAFYNQGRLYYWDQSIANADGLGGSEALGEWIPAAGLSMQAGKGYISQGPITGTYPLKAQVNFSGKPNNGEITLSGNSAIYNLGNPNDDLNLVGNPYPSAIDADEFINQNNIDINGTLWFWTHNTINNQNTSGEQYSSDDYASYNLSGGTKAASGGVLPNQYIASGQGYMVETLPTVSSIKFNNSMRIEDNNNQFFRGTDTKKASTLEKDRIWLNVESENGGAFSQILVGFFENATDGIDQGYDGVKISEGWVNLYSKIDSIKYGIQGLSSFNTDKKVALSFQTYIEDNTMNYNISIDKVEGILKNSEVFLVDNELNITHDLKQKNYNFSVQEAGSYPNRFTLQFTQTTLNAENFKIKNDFLINIRENTIKLKANCPIDYVKVYDITGRLLIEKNVNNSEIDINTQSINKGSILVINSFFEDNTSLSKKIILTK